jgi:hemolysin III
MKTPAANGSPRGREASPTVAEEVAAWLTHGAGFVASVAAGGALVWFTATHTGAIRPMGIAAVSAYAVSLSLLYAASTAYHAARHPRWKPLLRLVDHCAIFLLIAGTYTPVAVLGLGFARSRWLLALVWGMAAVGILVKLRWMGRFPILAPLFYLAMGWTGVFALRPLLATVGPGVVEWLVAGGVVYTLGVAFYAWKRLPFNHTVWHLFVLGGSVCHFVAIALVVGARA